jgi:hypothetical protein
MLRGDQVYGLAVPVSHAGPYQGKLNDGEELEADQRLEDGVREHTSAAKHIKSSLYKGKAFRDIRPEMYMRAAMEKSESVRATALTISSCPLRSVGVMTV